MENIRKSYKTYKKSATKPVDFQTYIILAAEYAKFLADKVILDAEKVALPAGLGTLQIKGKKQEITFDEEGNIQGAAPAWVRTKALRDNNKEAADNRKIVYHTNEHSGGVRYRFYWGKRRIPFFIKSLYSLRMSWTNKRKASALMKQGKEYLHN